MCQEMIQLWAELGTPQAQTDTTIVKYHRDSPEQLGLHKDDMAQLKAKRERLVEEKRSRERRLSQLRDTIEDLWERLGIEQSERKQFLTSNRGCGLRTINEFEDELARLNELKRQNLHLFVEEARVKLQELWDALYFSEEEMLDFTPAFSGEFISFNDVQSSNALQMFAVTPFYQLTKQKSRDLKPLRYSDCQPSRRLTDIANLSRSVTTSQHQARTHLV